MDRHPDGTAKIAVPDEGPELTTEQLYRRRLYLNGITELSKQDAMWEVERKRLAAMNERTRKRKRGKRRGK